MTKNEEDGSEDPDLHLKMSRLRRQLLARKPASGICNKPTSAKVEANQKARLKAARLRGLRGEEPPKAADDEKRARIRAARKKGIQEGSK